MNETIQVLEDLVDEYEILIINDGSTDRTGLIADAMSKKFENVRAVHHQSNQGYGSALISGFKNAEFEWVFFADGDNQFIISEIDGFLNKTNNFDRILGYRKERFDPWYRLIYSWAWNKLIKGLFYLKIRDINCAFKLLRKDLLKDITLVSTGALISAELLIKTGISNPNTLELPVSHRPRVYGKPTGGNIKVVFKAFVELFGNVQKCSLNIKFD